MFTQIAAEQPDLQVPTEEQIGYRVLAMAAQSTLIEYGYRRRLPDAVGVAR